MSFDLAVWHSENTLGDQDALEIYTKLCEEWPFLQGTHPNVAFFYRELIEEWPEIDTIPEENVGDFDLCPWSCELSHSGMAVVMSCVWPKAGLVAKRVTDLAAKHSLVLFDPQSGRVVLPQKLQKAKPSWFQRLLRRRE